ncbi:hypothetical protein SKAU_G00146520 [Synaphobranchus kaupii]|uniref:Uncharacterized protein n=1 Tax=Synaphobranchus kaupii TaxID=118154 RepID=A0A9Q1FTZ4_SYNKA|nr:hypothetical protein SKAU_G00146520 [Synaphobranchus kaupii]
MRDDSSVGANATPEGARPAQTYASGWGRGRGDAVGVANRQEWPIAVHHIPLVFTELPLVQRRVERSEGQLRVQERRRTRWRAAARVPIAPRESGPALPRPTPESRLWSFPQTL